MPPLSRVDSASHRPIYAGHVHQADGVVLGYPSHQTIAPVRGHARQRAHSGIEGGPWSTCPAERAWLHGLTPLFRFLLLVRLSAGRRRPPGRTALADLPPPKVGVGVGQL